MADRQFFASRVSAMDHTQMWNHRNHDRHQHLENGSPMLPTYDIAISGVNSLAYLTAPRRNNYPPLSFSMDAPNFGASNSGMLQNTYLHPASSVSSSQFQSNQVPHESSDNRTSIGYRGSIVDANMNNGRVSFKENWPSMPMVSDREYSDGYYCAGASSNLHTSSDPFQCIGYQGSIVDANVNNGRVSFKENWPSMPMVSDRVYSDGYYCAGASSNLHTSSDPFQCIGYRGSIVDANMKNGRVSFKENWPSMPMVSDREYSDGYYCAGASSNLHISSDPFQCIGYRGSIVDTNMNNGRVSFKENWPSMPRVSDREYSDGYYCAGASSNLHISSDPFQWKHMPSPQYHSLSPFCRVPSCWNGYLAGEGSQRNIRSHHSHAVHLETQLPELFSSRSIPYHFQSTANISGSNVAGQPFHSMGISDRSVARHDIKSLANLGGPNVAGQCHHYSQSIDPHNRILSSDSYSNYEMNRFLTASSITNGDVERAYNSSLTQSRYSNTMLPPLHCASTRGMELGCCSYDERPTNCSAIQSNPPMGFAATSLEDAGPSRVEAAASYRYSRPLSTTGHSIERRARARNSYDRLHSFPYADDYTNNIWLSEFVDIVDPLTPFLFDELMGMSLDIDEMSYEELLALEEMIGDVSTGLSKDSVSNCLTEMIHCSSHRTQDDDEERKCVICQEEYADGEKLGKLKCGHDFHTSCIKKWLLTKNACPMCKAPALSDSSKEKQVISHN